MLLLIGSWQLWRTRNPPLMVIKCVNVGASTRRPKRVGVGELTRYGIGWHQRHLNREHGMKYYDCGPFTASNFPFPVLGEHAHSWLDFTLFTIGPCRLLEMFKMSYNINSIVRAPVAQLVEHRNSTWEVVSSTNTQGYSLFWEPD